MIVYRVAEGNGWTKDTYAEVTRAGTGGGMHLSNLSGTLGFTGTENSTDKTMGSGVHIAQEMSVYTHTRYGSSSVQV